MKLGYTIIYVPSVELSLNFLGKLLGWSRSFCTSRATMANSRQARRLSHSHPTRWER